MTSLTAGSPSCNCKNPDTCIHAFTLKVKDRTFTYKQNGFIDSVDAIDEGGKGVPLSLTLTGKACVSHNPKCPQGEIYSIDESKTLKTFNNGVTSYPARFDSSKVRFFDRFDSIDFLVDYVLAKDVKTVMPKTAYMLHVGQCRGESFVQKPLTFADGVSQIINLAPSGTVWANINIFPDFKWETSVSIGAGQTVDEYSDQQLRRQQRAQNASEGMPQRGHRGWTRRPRYSITSSLEIEGKLTAKMGGLSQDYSGSLKKDFERKAQRISLINKSMQTIDTVTKALSTNDGGGKIKLLNTEILFPKLEIKGSGELKEDADSKSLYIERQVSLGLAPLVGMKITLDLLQAFAAWYRADVVLAAVREGLASGEQNYQDGGNAAFVGMKFDLVAEGEVALTLAFKSDAKSKWEWQTVDIAEAKLKLTIEANVRAGIRIYIANGALTVGGKAVAEGCLGLDNSVKDKLDLVFYHNGIVAKVYVNYTVGLASKSERASQSQGLPGRTSSTGKSGKGDNIEKEWVIHDKLEKKNSTARFNLA